VVEEVEAYYMCVYLRDGKPIGHEGKPKNDFPASLEDAGKKPAEPKILPSGMEVISGICAADLIHGTECLLSNGRSFAAEVLGGKLRFLRANS